MRSADAERHPRGRPARGCLVHRGRPPGRPPGCLTAHGPPLRNKSTTTFRAKVAYRPPRRRAVDLSSPDPDEGGDACSSSFSACPTPRTLSALAPAVPGRTGLLRRRTTKFCAGAPAVFPPLRLHRSPRPGLPTAPIYPDLPRTVRASFRADFHAQRPSAVVGDGESPRPAGEVPSVPISAAALPLFRPRTHPSCVHHD